MRGVILAGGEGKRLSPLTDEIQKVLLPVWNKPLIFYAVEKLIEGEVQDIAIVMGRKSPGSIIRLLGDGTDWNCRFSYYFKSGGVAAAIGATEDFARGENICVLTGDNIILDDLSGWIKSFETGGFVSHKVVSDSKELTSLKIDGNNVTQVIDSRMDAKHSGLWTKYAYAGLLIFDNTVFEKIRALKPSKRGELEVAKLLQMYVDEDSLTTGRLKKEWIDTGTFENLYQANKLLRRINSGI